MRHIAEQYAYPYGFANTRVSLFANRVTPPPRLPRSRDPTAVRPDLMATENEYFALGRAPKPEGSVEKPLWIVSQITTTLPPPSIGDGSPPNLAGGTLRAR